MPTALSMGEYGPKVAMPRILDLLDDYEIKSTFFVPGFIAENNADLMVDIVDRGHEVGHHGYMHEPPATLTAEQEWQVLEKGYRHTGEDHRRPAPWLPFPLVGAKPALPPVSGLPRFSLRHQPDGRRRAVPRRNAQGPAGGATHPLAVGRRAPFLLFPRHGQNGTDEEPGRSISELERRNSTAYTATAAPFISPCTPTSSAGLVGS